MRFIARPYKIAELYPLIQFGALNLFPFHHCSVSPFVKRSEKDIEASFTNLLFCRGYRIEFNLGYSFEKAFVKCCITNFILSTLRKSGCVNNHMLLDLLS